MVGLGLLMRKGAEDKLYMDLAKRVAQESYCVRQKVGAAIVTNVHGLFLGFNGTPSGYQNVCELSEGVSDPLVIHAEENALSKMLKEGVAASGAKLYTTLSPCVECTKMLYSAGIKEVNYLKDFRSTEHLDTFRELGMVIRKWEEVE